VIKYQERRDAADMRTQLEVIQSVLSNSNFENVQYYYNLEFSTLPVLNIIVTIMVSSKMEKSSVDRFDFRDLI